MFLKRRNHLRVRHILPPFSIFFLSFPLVLEEKSAYAICLCIGNIGKTVFCWLGIGCRKRGLKTNEFSTLFALPFWGAYGGGSCPQEYEVDMLGRHIILSTYRRFLNF